MAVSACMGAEPEQAPTPAKPSRRSIRLGPEDFQPFAIIQETLKNKKPPRVLYHYTGAAGLVGIVRSETLWLTHVSFLNDRSEMIHARDLISETLAEQLKSPPDGRVVPFLQDAEKMVPTMFRDLDLYVACFCEEGDLLSQWRGYSKGVGMYAMGFSSESLHRPGQPGPAPYSLYPVIYRQDEQRRMVRDIITRAVRRYLLGIRGPLQEDTNEVLTTLGLLMVSLSSCLIFLKHGSFEAEREWRMVLVKTAGDDVRVSFRDERSYPTPYTKVSFNKGSLPLLEVKCGPAPEPELARRSAEMLLAESGYPTVSVNSSDVPLRW